MSYCHFIAHQLHTVKPEAAALNKRYHDHYYGFPLDDDNELFGRLILEINQAGLSWTLMLVKEENFRLAFANFSINSVAVFGAGLLAMISFFRMRAIAVKSCDLALLILDLDLVSSSTFYDRFNTILFFLQVVYRASLKQFHSTQQDVSLK